MNHNHPIGYENLVMGFISANKHAGWRLEFQNVSPHFFPYTRPGQ